MHVLNEEKQAVSMHHTQLIKALLTFSNLHLLSSQRNTISLFSFLMSIIDNHVKSTITWQKCNGELQAVY